VFDDDDMDDDEMFEETMLTPIERAIAEERVLLRTIRSQQLEIADLRKELAALSAQAMSHAQSSSAWMLHAALNGAFTDKSVKAMGDMPADTVGAALVAAAANQPNKE